MSKADLRKSIIEVLAASGLPAAEQTGVLLEIAEELGGPKAAPEIVSQWQRDGKKITSRDQLPPLPEGMEWPTEQYNKSEECKLAKQRKIVSGIIPYLERVWLPLIEAGVPISYRILEFLDKSARKGIENYQNPPDGPRRELPAHLQILTKKQENDRMFSNSGLSLKDFRRLGSAARRRMLIT